MKKICQKSACFWGNFRDFIRMWPKQNLLMRQSFSDSLSLSSKVILAIQGCKVHYFYHKCEYEVPWLKNKPHSVDTISFSEAHYDQLIYCPSENKRRLTEVVFSTKELQNVSIFLW